MITNHHVSNTGTLRCSTGSYTEYLKCKKEIPKEEKVVFSGDTSLCRKDSLQFMAELEKTFPSLYQVYQDPISSLVGDFNYFDISILKMTCFDTFEWPKVFFIPSPKVLQIDNDIFMTHFPGCEGKRFSGSISGHEDYKQCQMMN